MSDPNIKWGHNVWNQELKDMSISEIYESGEQKSHIAHFAAIANIAVVDGRMNEEEIKLLRQFARKLDMDELQYETIKGHY
ncbi:hypothetical protein [Flagellimonas sp.]|uniref:hypothetical protein n=1 Tax=Flagellimonas sp. TaxID=2058762 RepID=UPI003B515482